MTFHWSENDIFVDEGIRSPNLSYMLRRSSRRPENMLSLLGATGISWWMIRYPSVVIRWRRRDKRESGWCWCRDAWQKGRWIREGEEDKEMVEAEKYFEKTDHVKEEEKNDDEEMEEIETEEAKKKDEEGPGDDENAMDIDEEEDKTEIKMTIKMSRLTKMVPQGWLSRRGSTVTFSGDCQDGPNPLTAGSKVLIRDPAENEDVLPDAAKVFDILIINTARNCTSSCGIHSLRRVRSRSTRRQWRQGPHQTPTGSFRLCWATTQNFRWSTQWET